MKKIFLIGFCGMLMGAAAFAESSLYERLEASNTPYEERSRACLAILDKADDIGTSHFPALLDTLERSHGDLGVREVVVAFIRGSQVILLSTNPQAIQDIAPDLRERLLKTFEELVIDERGKVKENAYAVIGCFGKGRPEVETFLLKRVEEESGLEGKGEAIGAFVYFGIQSKESLALILKALQSDESALFASASNVVAENKVPEALPVLAANLMSSNSELQRTAVFTLHRYGRAAKSVWPQILAANAKVPDNSPSKEPLEALIKELSQS